MIEVLTSQSLWLWVGLAGFCALAITGVVIGYRRASVHQDDRWFKRMCGATKQADRDIDNVIVEIARNPPTEMLMCIEAAQFLASVDERCRSLCQIQPLSKEICQRLISSAARLLAGLFERAEAGDDEAFSELRNLFVSVAPPSPKIVKLFGVPSLILSPFELFVRCGLKPESYTRWFSNLAERHRSAISDEPAD